MYILYTTNTTWYRYTIVGRFAARGTEALLCHCIEHALLSSNDVGRDMYEVWVVRWWVVWWWVVGGGGGSIACL